jgi:hypothetical protein
VVLDRDAGRRSANPDTLLSFGAAQEIWLKTDSFLAESNENR